MTYDVLYDVKIRTLVRVYAEGKTVAFDINHTQYHIPGNAPSQI